MIVKNTFTREWHAEHRGIHLGFFGSESEAAEASWNAIRARRSVEESDEKSRAWDARISKLVEYALLHSVLPRELLEVSPDEIAGLDPARVAKLKKMVREARFEGLEEPLGYEEHRGG